MIGFVNGIVEYISEDVVVIDVNGIGINVHVSTDTAAKMPSLGEEAKLYTYTSVREDAIWLYGFLTRKDLEIFKKCITVNGIGPKGALSILSVMDADSLRYAISAGDKKAIAKAPGVGPKMAERLILELKDKIKYDDDLIDLEIAKTASGSPLLAADTPQKKEAVEALVALGYGQTESVKAVNSIPDIDSLDSGAILKAALKKMF